MAKSPAVSPFIFTFAFFIPKKYSNALFTCCFVIKSNLILNVKRLRLASSRVSSKFVVQTNGYSCDSIQVSISFTCAISQFLTALFLFCKKESASSKISIAFFVFASAKASAIFCSVSPTYFDIKSLALFKITSSPNSFARYLAYKLLPVPGSP